MNSDNLSKDELIQEYFRITHHTGYTCDSRGAKAQYLNERYRDYLEGQIRDLPKHSLERCAECQQEKEILDELR